MTGGEKEGNYHQVDTPLYTQARSSKARNEANKASLKETHARHLASHLASETVFQDPIQNSSKQTKKRMIKKDWAATANGKQKKAKHGRPRFMSSHRHLPARMHRFQKSTSSRLNLARMPFNWAMQAVRGVMCDRRSLRNSVVQQAGVRRQGEAHGWCSEPSCPALRQLKARRKTFLNSTWEDMELEPSIMATQYGNPLSRFLNIPML